MIDFIIKALFLSSSGIPLFKIVNTNINTTDTNITDYKVGDYCDPIKFNATRIQSNDSSLFYLECNFFTIGFDPDFFNDLIKTNSSLVDKYSKIAVSFINKYQWIPQVFVLFMFFWLISFVLGIKVYFIFIIWIFKSLFY